MISNTYLFWCPKSPTLNTILPNPQSLPNPQQLYIPKRSLPPAAAAPLEFFLRPQKFRVPKQGLRDAPEFPGHVASVQAASQVRMVKLHGI